jgi:polyisoprenoid-binding protein YceI
VRVRFRFLHWAWLATTVLLAAGGRAGAAEPLAADSSGSVLAVRTSKTGLFSGFAHNHRFVVQRWHAEVRFDPHRPSEIEMALVADAGSLHDRESRLTEASRAEVDSTAAGAEVLDASRFPEIRYRAAEVVDLKVASSGEVEGVLRGELSLHGVRRPLEVRFQARAEGAGFRATGSALLLQSDFGMRPYRTALGTIGVDDAVQVEFDLVLLPPGAARLARQGASLKEP